MQRLRHDMSIAVLFCLSFHARRDYYGHRFMQIQFLVVNCLIIGYSAKFLYVHFYLIISNLMKRWAPPLYCDMCVASIDL